jgi:hypothetical protein
MRFHTDEHGNVLPRFAELMVKLAGAWGTRLDEVRIRVYALALGDVPFDDVQRACGQAIKESRYFPSVAELRACVAPSGEDAGLIAWTALWQAAATVGAYVSIVVEDGAAAEALETVFGSWAVFCETDDGPGLGARRQEFLAAYRAARRRARGPVRLIGLLPAVPDALAGHVWVARIAGARVTVERGGQRQLCGAERAALPAGREKP